MKIFDEVQSGLVVKLSDRDRYLVTILDGIPFFVRRYFIVEFENLMEESFLDFYTSDGFGEHCNDAELVRIPLEKVDGISRVLFCNVMIYEGAYEIIDFIREYNKTEWYSDCNNPDTTITLYETVYGKNEENSDIKVKTFEFLRRNKFIETASDELLEKLRKEESERKEVDDKKFYSDITEKYREIDVAFLAD